MEIAYLEHKREFENGIQAKKYKTSHFPKKISLIVPRRVNWNKNCYRRLNKAVAALILIKSSFTNLCEWKTKFNVYTRSSCP